MNEYNKLWGAYQYIHNENRAIIRRRESLEYRRDEDHLPGERMVNRAIWGADYNPEHYGLACQKAMVRYKEFLCR